jgi:hypothetical protein
MQRSGARDFRTLVGSLLESLPPEPRKDIMLMPSIANVDPSVHQAYNEPWVSGLTHQVLTYEPVSTEDRSSLRLLESPDGHDMKARFDYSYMLSRCVSSGAP